MTPTIGRTLAACIVAIWLPGHGARAADAAHPYSNVDHSVDAGNDTGDSQVDRLNQQQLDRATTPTNQSRWVPPPRAGLRPGYYPPHPGFAYGAPPPVVVVAPYQGRRRRWWHHRWVYIAP